MKKVGRNNLAYLIAVIIFVTSLPITVHATSSTLDKLNQAQQEHASTQSQLNQANQQIDGLEDVKTGLQGELNTLTNQLTEVSNKLDDLEGKISDKEAQIEQTGIELSQAKVIEEEQYASMKKRVQFMYEKGDNAYLEMLLSAASFSEFLNRTDYINKLSQYDRKMLLEYQATKAKIQEQEALQVQEKADLDSMKVQVEEQQKQVNTYVSQTSNSIAGYANQISAAEQQALAYENKIKEQEQNIAALKKQYEQEIAMSQLAAASSKRDISEITFAEGDLKLLATIIYCEAGGEPYAGKLAVGAVVVNRVLSSVYPDTVVGVIYQRKQFSPVASGRFELALANGTATSSCYQAAQEAMSGATNVGGCVYFRTPIEGLTGISIGGHIFY